MAVAPASLKPSCCASSSSIAPAKKYLPSFCAATNASPSKSPSNKHKTKHSPGTRVCDPQHPLKSPVNKYKTKHSPGTRVCDPQHAFKPPVNKHKMNANFLKTKCLVLLFISLICHSDAATGKKPNILFCIADDWGWPHAGAYGDKVVNTPTFDRVAREGVLFKNAF